MATVLDYIYWRGGDSFEERPFCTEDSFVFSLLSYLDLDEALAVSPDAPLSDLAAILDAKKHLTARVVNGNKDYNHFNELYRAAAASKRFGALKVTDYENTYDENKTQFVAMRFVVENKFSFIAFRGTDETITGWKEDFVGTFTKTYAQERSGAYLSGVLSNTDDNETIYVGGHSKGGNLAMIGTASISDSELRKITHIYSLDGPGIADDVMDTSFLSRIQDKFTEIVPEYCIIGRLFTKKIMNCRIVKSEATGLGQHNVTSWRIGPDGPVWTDSFDPSSVTVVDTIDDWIFDADHETRENFVNMFFDSMRAYGSSKFNELGHGGPAEIESILVSMASSGASNIKMAMSFPRHALFGSGPSLPERFAKKIGLRKKELFFILVMFIAGILFLVLPLSGIALFAALIMLVPVAYEIYLTFKTLKSNNWNLKDQRPRVMICLGMIGIYILLMFKNGALSFLASTLLGIVFLIMSYGGASDMRKYIKKRKIRMIFFAMEMVAFAVLGLYTLIAPDHELWWYSNYIGIAFIADSAFRLVMTLSSENEEAAEKT